MINSFSYWKSKYKLRDKGLTVGRFAPSPTGHMHLGNVWAALFAWLEVRKQEGVMILRVEDLDPDRSKQHFTDRIISDMNWLGLDWDEGPDKGGAYGPYTQDERREIYESALGDLKSKGLVYPCFCTRKELRASSAPHKEDGVFIYNGKCKHLDAQVKRDWISEKRHAWRIEVPDNTIEFEDLNYGVYKQNIKTGCGDFVLTRGDGIHAYQLAVVLDDALMGVNSVVRGADLIDSSPRQIFLHETFGYSAPSFGHVPLLKGENAKRLSKRHQSLDLGNLRDLGWTAEAIIGLLAFKGGLIDRNEAVKASDLIDLFDWAKVPTQDIVLFDKELEK